MVLERRLTARAQRLSRDGDGLCLDCGVRYMGEYICHSLNPMHLK